MSETATETTTPENAVEQTIKRLKKEYGRIVFARTPMGLVACRPPTSGEHQRVTDEVRDEKKSDYQATKKYVMACRIYPEPDQFRSILDSFPVLPAILSDGLVEIAGGDIEIETGK